MCLVRNRTGTQPKGIDDLPAKRQDGKRTQVSKARQREIAIAALMMTSGHAEAAKRAGVSAQILRGWLREPAFIQQYRTAERNLIETVRARLRAGMVHSIRILQQIEDDSNAPHAARVAASSALLKYGLRSIRGADSSPRK